MNINKKRNDPTFTVHPAFKAPGGHFLFILYTIAFTLVEFTCGHLCHLIFGIDMWNYTSKKYNIGKYICLEYMPIWGLYGLTITYILKPFLDKIIKQIPREVTYLFIILLSLDLIITILTK